MDNDKKIDKSSEQKNMPWASALDGAMTMSSWLVGPLIVGFLVGSYFDNKYLTGGHKYLYICLGLAFLLTIVGLVTEVMKFIKWTSFAEATEDRSSNSKAETTADSSYNLKTTADKSSSAEATKVTSAIVKATADKSSDSKAEATAEKPLTTEASDDVSSYAETSDDKNQINIKK